MITYTAADLSEIRLLLLSLASGMDILDNQPSTPESELQTIQEAIEADFAGLDRLGVPYIVQNAAIGAGNRNKGTRPASFLIHDILSKYAHRLTPEARQEWREFAEAQRAEARTAETVPLF